MKHFFSIRLFAYLTTFFLLPLQATLNIEEKKTKKRPHITIENDTFSPITVIITAGENTLYERLMFSDEILEIELQKKDINTIGIKYSTKKITITTGRGNAVTNIASPEGKKRIVTIKSSKKKGGRKKKGYHKKK